MKLPIEYTSGGFIRDADGNYVCQFFNNKEDDFDNSEKNATAICRSMNEFQSLQSQNRELVELLNEFMYMNDGISESPETVGATDWEIDFYERAEEALSNQTKE